MPVKLVQTKNEMTLKGSRAPWISVNGKADARKPTSLVCLINALGTGGAESMLYRLLANLDRAQFRVRVMTLVDSIEPFGPKIRALGIPVDTLGMRRGIPNPLSALRLARWLREDPPDVLQTWQYHSDLIGGLASRMVGGIPLVWGIRHSDHSPGDTKRLTMLTMSLCATLSRWLPDRIICCSEASRRVHLDVGYAPEKMVVIPNGYDLAAYRPDLPARGGVLKELDIPEGASVIGMAARFDPQKDFRNFIQAAALLHRRRPDAYYVLCGTDVTWENGQLRTCIAKAGLQDRFRLLGRRSDMPRLFAALDIAALSSSYGEGFPNVVAEAMSCGVPCAVTDVGDAALIVGDTGRVVPLRNPEALAEAWQQLMDLGAEGRTRLGIAARQRIKDHYDLPQIVHRFQSLFQELACPTA